MPLRLRLRLRCLGRRRPAEPSGFLAEAAGAPAVMAGCSLAMAIPSLLVLAVSEVRTPRST